MTRNSLLLILSLLMVVHSSTTNAATRITSGHTQHRAKEIRAITEDEKARDIAGHHGAATGTKAEELEKKQKPASEELAHIHKFHKDRVKKIKRHHKKYWVLSKLILVLCHVALLVIAYLHLTH